MLKTVKKQSKLKSVILLFIAVVMFLLCFVGVGGSIAKAEEKDNTVNVEEKTGYLFTIPVKGLSGYITPDDKMALNGRDVMRAFKRNDVLLTVIFGMVNITHFENPLIVSVPVQLNFPAATSLNYRIDFLQNVQVNIRKEYYDMLKDGDFSKIRVTILVKGDGIPVMEKFPFPQGYFSSLAGCVAEVGDVSGIYPDNGGEEVNVAKTWLERIYDVLTDLFKWNLSYEDFKTWLIIIGVGIIAIILLPMIIRLVKAIVS